MVKYLYTLSIVCRHSWTVCPGNIVSCSIFTIFTCHVLQQPSLRTRSYKRPSPVRNYTERSSDRNHTERLSDRNYTERLSDRNYTERSSSRNHTGNLQAFRNQYKSLIISYYHFLIFIIYVKCMEPIVNKQMSCDFFLRNNQVAISSYQSGTVELWSCGTVELWNREG